MFLLTFFNYRVMKKLLFVVLTLFTLQLVCAQSYNDDPYGYDDPYRSIVGLTNITWNGSASGSYELWQPHIKIDLPSNGRYVWSIRGTRAYCYPNGKYCSVSFAARGGYLLTCEVYDASGNRLDSFTVSITVM